MLAVSRRRLGALARARKPGGRGDLDIVDPETGKVLKTVALSRVRQEKKRMEEELGKKLELKLTPKENR